LLSFASARMKALSQVDGATRPNPSPTWRWHMVDRCQLSVPEEHASARVHGDFLEEHLIPSVPPN
jgi:hypothetical protein